MTEKKTRVADVSLDNTERCPTWLRPSAPSTIPTATLALQVMAVEPVRIQNEPVVKLSGITDEGYSVTIYAKGFLPYFWVELPAHLTDSTTPAFLEAFCGSLNGRLRNAVRSVDVFMRQTILGFPSAPKPHIRVSLNDSSAIRQARELLKKGIRAGPNSELIVLKTFESSWVPFALRFMVDTGICGGGWIEVGTDRLERRAQPDTHCQYEFDVHYSAITSHDALKGHWGRVAPLRILSFDIECAGRPNLFPEAHTDPVIQIANVLYAPGNPVPLLKVIFTLDTCDAIYGADVRSFSSEMRLLSAWRDFVIATDPDILTGYNILNFDLPYLLDRAATLGVTQFAFLGRTKTLATTVRDKVLESRAFGKNMNKDVDIQGRIILDALQIFRREEKLRSYTLNAVSAHFLKQQKEDVHHSEITKLQNGTAETRKRLAVYCLKDAILPMKLLEKLLKVVNAIEMARVTGIPIGWLYSRGQSIKVVSQLLRRTKESLIIIPDKDMGHSDEKYAGATVLEPKRGFYTHPIVTLDFASLYPSIMIAHNMCYTTLVDPQYAKTHLKPEDYTVTMRGHCFVKSHIRRGILPDILVKLGAARKQAKVDMAIATVPFLKAVLDGRQLSLKISANSVYGFTGATVGQLPCIEISESVTAFGRSMIEHTKQMVEEKYGPSDQAQVIYGDTDSVMILFPNKTVEQAMALGKQAADMVSATFIKPIKLEFEKVFYPYLLCQKKRYAGVKYEEGKPGVIAVKGLEVERRDNCLLAVKTMKRVIEIMLKEQNMQKVEEYIKNVVSQLLLGKIDVYELVISKALSKGNRASDYATKAVHVELAERLRKRNPANAPKSGDRVPYVMIRGTKKSKKYENGEDPLFVMENNLLVDTQFYLEKALQQPLSRILEHVLSTTRFHQLFHGDHTNSIKVASSTSGALSTFVIKRSSCAGCKAILKPNEKGVCTSCRPVKAEICIDRIQTAKQLEQRSNRLWSQCQRCQGSLIQEVTCANNDCPIYYQRKQVWIDLKAVHAVLSELE